MRIISLDHILLSRYRCYVNCNNQYHYLLGFKVMTLVSLSTYLLICQHYSLQFNMIGICEFSIIETMGNLHNTLWYYRLLGPLGDPWPMVFHVYSGTIDTLGECVSLHVRVYYTGSIL